MQSFTFVVLFSLIAVAMATPPAPTSAPGTVLCANAAWNTQALLKCPVGQVVDTVSYAWFGAQSTGTCGNYVPACGFDHHTDVNAKCTGLTACDLMLNQYVFPDYSTAQTSCGAQQLYVQFTCKLNAKAPVVCAEGDENSDGALLQCPTGTVIDQITYAVYGSTPAGTCGSYATTACIHNSIAASQVTSCKGQTSCTIPGNNGVWGDPCVGTYKHIYVQYTCGVQHSLALILDTSDPNAVVYGYATGVLGQLPSLSFQKYFFSSWALTDPLVSTPALTTVSALNSAIQLAGHANKIWKVGNDHNDWAYMFGYLEAQLKIVGSNSAIVVALDEEMLCDAQLNVLRPNHQETYTIDFQNKANDLKTTAAADGVALHFVVFPSSAQGFCHNDGKAAAVAILTGMAGATSGSFANAIDIISQTSLDAAGQALHNAIVPPS